MSEAEVFAILWVGFCIYGAIIYFRRWRSLKPDPQTPGDYEDLGERVWVNWSDPQLDMMWKVVRQPWRAGEPPAPLSGGVLQRSDDAPNPEGG